MTNKQIGIVVSIFLVIALSGGLYSLKGCKEEVPTPSPTPAPEKPEQPLPSKKENPIKIEDVPDRDSKEIMDDAGVPSTFDSPEALMKHVQEVLSKNQADGGIMSVLKNSSASEGVVEKFRSLQEYMKAAQVKLSGELPIEEIGELRRGKKTRWALNLDNGQRAFLDMEKGADGKWRVTDILMPSGTEDILKSGNAQQLDALLTVHSFVKFALALEYAKARQLVDPAGVSDAKLAGLCIIFEEGGYELRAEKAVRAAFMNERTAGFSVNTVSATGAEADFSLVLRRNDKASPWLIREVNLGKLFEDYIKQLADGDSYYTPLVKDPKGGDSLVIYFEFNEEELSKRTQRQLQIVANILLLDANKRIKLTGHTDSVGGDDYNQKLSKRRAAAVKSFLVKAGVKPEQITTIGYGAHRPRLANKKADGTDNPEGRRANRRTEIYLDF